MSKVDRQTEQMKVLESWVLENKCMSAFQQGRNMVYGLRAQSPKYDWDQGSEQSAQGSEDWDQGSQGF